MKKKNLNRVFIVAGILVILLINVFIISNKFRNRYFLQTNSAERVEETFMERHFLTKFDTVMRIENEKMIAFLGCDEKNNMYYDIYVEAELPGVWRLEDYGTVSKRDSAKCIEVPACGRLYMANDTSGIAGIVLEQNGKTKEYTVDSQTPVFQLVGEDVESVRFFAEDGTELIEEEIFR